MHPELLLQVATVVGSCAACYVAIRVDLARLHERVNAAHDEAKRANKRLDDLLRRN